MKNLVFERLPAQYRPAELRVDAPVFRAKIPGGWLVVLQIGQASGTFVPDPEHKWDGASLD